MAEKQSGFPWILFVLVSLPLVGLGGAIVFDTWQSHRRQASAVSTECTVVESAVNVGFDEEERQQKGYYAKVVLVHEIEGREYRGRDGSDMLQSEAEARARLRPYAEGAEVRCWYSPDEPTTVWVFEPDSGVLTLRNGVAAAMFLAPLVLFLYWRRR